MLTSASVGALDQRLPDGAVAIITRANASRIAGFRRAERSGRAQLSYREQIAASNEVMGSFDLDASCARSDKVNENLRWVATHMIEETARHAGHADIIRETIDGTCGR